jgi:hypothetical protein
VVGPQRVPEVRKKEKGYKRGETPIKRAPLFLTYFKKNRPITAGHVIAATGAIRYGCP